MIGLVNYFLRFVYAFLYYPKLIHMIPFHYINLINFSRLNGIFLFFGHLIIFLYKFFLDFFLELLDLIIAQSFKVIQIMGRLLLDKFDL